jgi:hypothetical protein
MGYDGFMKKYRKTSESENEKIKPVYRVTWKRRYWTVGGSGRYYECKTARQEFKDRMLDFKDRVSRFLKPIKRNDL